MTYLLVIWAFVGSVHQSLPSKYEWRPLGEFHQDNWKRELSAAEMCHAAAKELGLTSDKYRCVRNK